MLEHDWITLDDEKLELSIEKTKENHALHELQKQQLGPFDQADQSRLKTSPQPG